MTASRAARSSRPRSTVLLLVASIVWCPRPASSQSTRAGMEAQGRYIATAVQFVSQGGPLGGYSGAGILLSAAADLRPGLALGLVADFAALRRSGDDISLCLPIPGGGCLTSPDGRAFLSFAVAAEWRIPLGTGFRPFVAAGPVYGRLLGSPVDGSRRAWVQPSVEAGLLFGEEAPGWSVSARWRRVDSWVDRGPYSELGLLLGFRL